MPVNRKRSNKEKVHLFRTRFSGLQHVYGTYDPVSGRAWQVKQPVTDAVLLAHLTGKRPYGVYLLTGSVTRAIAADFDNDNMQPPLDFINAAKHYDMPCYLEVSKSKGFHVWSFADECGVSAAKARAVFKRILEEIQMPATEIFPKQDYIIMNSTNYGNFINAPLFGALVQKGRTVFIDLTDVSLRPAANQWDALESIELVSEELLDDIIAVNDIPFSKDECEKKQPSLGAFQPLPGSLPSCARRMLVEGVSEYQRVSCFRLAVQLRKVGLPPDITMAALQAWALKNHPKDGRRILAEEEIKAQTAAAFLKEYRGNGCEEPAAAAFCDASCELFQGQGNT